MKKIAIVYWSGTGNTEAMATAVLEGAKNKGAQAVMLTSAAFDASMLISYDAIAFGCPSMGTEVLEEDEFEPMFSSCEAGLKEKAIALFGSYGWGDGAWMRDWEERCISDGAKLVCDSVICNGSPDAEGISACKLLGAALAE